MPETDPQAEDDDRDWIARHARTKPSETRPVVRVPDDVVEEWDDRHAETKRRF